MRAEPAALAAAALTDAVLAAAVLAAVAATGTPLVESAGAVVVFWVAPFAAAPLRVVGIWTITSIPCSSIARTTALRRRSRVTAASVMATTSCSPVMLPVVRPLRTNSCRAGWPNSLGNAGAGADDLGTGVGNLSREGRSENQAA